MWVERPNFVDLDANTSVLSGVEANQKAPTLPALTTKLPPTNPVDHSPRSHGVPLRGVAAVVLCLVAVLGLGTLASTSASAQASQEQDAETSTPELRMKNRRNLHDGVPVVLRITSDQTTWRLRQCAAGICENVSSGFVSQGRIRRVSAIFERFVGDVDCVTAKPRCEVQLFSVKDTATTVDSLPLHFDPQGPSGVAEIRVSKTEDLQGREVVKVSTHRGYLDSIRQCTTDAAGEPNECTLLSRTSFRKSMRVEVQRGLFEHDCAEVAGSCVLLARYTGRTIPDDAVPLHFDPTTPAPELLDIFMSRYDDLVDGQPVIVRLAGVNHRSTADHFNTRISTRNMPVVHVRQCALVDGELVTPSCIRIIWPSIAVVDGGAEFDGPVRRLLTDETTASTYDCAFDECVAVFQIGGSSTKTDPTDGAIFRWRTISFDPSIDPNPANPRIVLDIRRTKHRTKVDLEFLDLPVQFSAITPKLCGTVEQTGETRCRPFLYNLTADHYGHGEGSKTIRRAKEIVPGVDCRKSDCWFHIFNRGRGYSTPYDVVSDPFRI